MNTTTRIIGEILAIVMIGACAMSNNTAGVIAGIFVFLVMIIFTEDEK